MDIAALDKQNAEITPRVLSTAERQEERELVQKVTKIVRTDAKVLVPILDEKLPAQLHRLERIVLQLDKLSSADHFESFEESVELVEHLKNSITEQLAEIRKHVG